MVCRKSRNSNVDFSPAPVAEPYGDSWSNTHQKGNCSASWDHSPSKKQQGTPLASSSLTVCHGVGSPGAGCSIPMLKQPPHARLGVRDSMSGIRCGPKWLQGISTDRHFYHLYQWWWPSFQLVYVFLSPGDLGAYKQKVSAKAAHKLSAYCVYRYFSILWSFCLTGSLAELCYLD